MTEQYEFHEACKDGDLEKVEILISEAKLKGSILSIINAKDSIGRTPLHWASRNGHVKVMELLISYGADYSELMEQYEKNGREWSKKRIEELERVVIEVGMGKVKMI